MSTGESEVSAKGKVSGSAELDLFHMKMLSVFESIRWLKGIASREQIIALSAMKNIIEGEVESILEILLTKKCIKEKDGYLVALTDNIFSGDMELANQVKMYQMFSDFRKLHIRRKH